MSENIRGLYEAYTSIYFDDEVDQELISENKMADTASSESDSGNKYFNAALKLKPNTSGSEAVKKANQTTTPVQKSGPTRTASQGKPAGSAPGPGTTAATTGTKPADNKTPTKPSGTGTVLAKKGGVEGKLDKATGKFTAGNFNAAEKARYQKTDTANAVKKAADDKAAIAKAKTPEAKAAADKKATQSGLAAWAKANPKLAAAKAERDKTRGTAQSTNPLMKDMPGRNKSELERLRGNAALSSINKSPNAAKIMKTSPIAKQSLERSTAGLSKVGKDAANIAKKAGAPTPKPAPSPLSALKGIAKAEKPPQPLNQSLDLFDIVLGHLLDEGFAETEQAAMVIMANMSEEWRQNILEFLGGQSGDGYLGHPRLGIKNPLAKKQTKTRTSAGGGPDVAGTGRSIGNIRSRQEDMIRQTLGR